MEVVKELEKSVKFFKQASKELGKIDNFSDLDIFEKKTQTIVFNLQMQANQVAGELAPAIINKRFALQNAHTANALAKVRERLSRTNKVEEVNETTEDVAEPIENVEEAQVEEPEKVVEEVKVEDASEDNRQSKSKSGDCKSESSKKTK